MSFLFFVVMSISQAGFLRMAAIPHLEIQRENQNSYLSGELEIINEGNEPAQEISPEIQIDNFIWKGSAEDLRAGQGARWHIHEPLEQLCTKISPDCLQVLPTRGEFLVRLRKYYQDQNSFSFAVPDVFTVKDSNSKSTADLALQIDMKTLPAQEGLYSVDYTIKNITDEKLQLIIRPLLPDEVQLLATALPVSLPAHGEIAGSFQFRNIKGQPGSQYVGFLTAEWAQNKERRSAFAFTTFQIAHPQPVSGHWSPDQAFIGWWLWALGLGLLGMWAFWIRPLRKFRP